MFYCVSHPFQNYLKSEKNFFPSTTRKLSGSGSHEDFFPDPQKKADPKPWFGF